MIGYNTVNGIEVPGGAANTPGAALVPVLEVVMQNDSTLRRCTKCNRSLPTSDFSRHRGRRDGIDSQCLSCKAAALIRWRTESPQGISSTAEIEQFRVTAKALIAAAKESGCIVCGEREPVCLDFHHRNDAHKTETVSTLASKKQFWSESGLKQLRAEIAKCAVICANCHRKVHAGLVTRSV